MAKWCIHKSYIKTYMYICETATQVDIKCTLDPKYSFSVYKYIN